MGLAHWQIMFVRRKIFLRGAAVFGFILSPFFCAAQEYRLRIGVVADGSHELSWDSAGREAKYTVEYASDLAKPQWIQLSVGIRLYLRRKFGLQGCSSEIYDSLLLRGLIARAFEARCESQLILKKVKKM